LPLILDRLSTIYSLQDECDLYLDLIYNNSWLASVVSLQLSNDNHVLILGLAIQ